MKDQLNDRLIQGGANRLHKALNQALPSKMMPGNVGDLNKVIWPFWFTFSAPQLAPNSGANGFTTISQEAAFIWMSMSKTVFTKTIRGSTGAFDYAAIDGTHPNDALANANDLSVSIRDAQSSRVYMGRPIQVDMIGTAKKPTVLPTPQLILPSSTIEAAYMNNSLTVGYVPFITIFGYRLRLEYADQILSLITG